MLNTWEVLEHVVLRLEGITLRFRGFTNFAEFYVDFIRLADSFRSLFSGWSEQNPHSACC